MDRYERLWALVKNVEFHLEHMPEHPLSSVVEGTDYRALESDALFMEQRAGLPNMVVVYRFDDACVYIWDVRLVPPPDYPVAPLY